MSEHMCRCSVEVRYDDGAWLVTFTDGSSLLFESDYDKAAFAVNCRKIKPPVAWDGNPQRLNPRWRNLDARTIRRCPERYESLARGHYHFHEHRRVVLPGALGIERKSDASSEYDARVDSTEEGS